MWKHSVTSLASRRARPRLIFHVGMPKTGSSYLQSMFALNSDLLSQHGLHYPDSKSTAEARGGLITSGNFPGWGGLRNVLEHSPAKKTILFSSELLFLDLTNSQSAEKWKILMELHKHFRVDFLLFVRNPVAQKISRYQQYVKRRGVTEPLNSWITRQSLPPLEKFLRRSGEFGHTVYALNYSKHQPNLWRATLKSLGLRGGSRVPWRVPPHKTVNRSLSTGELMVQLAANQLDGWRSSPHLSDVFCNSAPAVLPAVPALSKRGYEVFVARISEPVAAINGLLRGSERLNIESFNPMWQESFEESLTKGDAILEAQAWNALVSVMAKQSGVSEDEISARLLGSFSSAVTIRPHFNGEIAIPRTALTRFVKEVQKITERLEP